jgi:predicted RNA-binding Zn-ribbon protein involved in translation (DUF1610 family)
LNQKESGKASTPNARVIRAGCHPWNLLAPQPRLPQYRNESAHRKMVTTNQCQHCRKEFEAEVEDNTVPCPHCGKETRTVIPRFAPSPQQIYMNETESNTPKTFPLPKKVKWGWLYVLGGVALVVPLVWLFSGWTGKWGESISTFIGIGMVCIVAGIVIWLVMSHIMEILTLLFICVGMFLIVSGLVDMFDISAAKEATVFQQIYALLEFVGGALVFCAAMILHLLRARLNPPAKANQKDSKPG